MPSNHSRGEKQREMLIIELQLFIVSAAIDLCDLHTFFLLHSFHCLTLLLSILLLFPPSNSSFLMSSFLPDCAPFYPYISAFLPCSPIFLPLLNSSFSASPLMLLHSLFVLSASLCALFEYHSSSFSHMSSLRGNHTLPSGLSWSVFTVHWCLSQRWRIQDY